MEDNQWRSTYSLQILDFKEGSDSAIGYFVKPFVELIKQALLMIGHTRAVLIPVPSSIAKSDPNFSSVPYNKAKMPKRKKEIGVLKNNSIHSHSSWMKLQKLILRMTLSSF